MVCQVHRCLQKQAPPYLCSKFITNSEFGYKGTRGANKLHLLRPNTNFYRNTFEFQGAQSYNNLPHSMRQISNHTTFRSALVSTCWKEPQCLFIYLIFLTFLLCAAFNFYNVCIVIAQLYLICFVPSSSFFPCTLYVYPGPVCKPAPCVDTTFLLQIKILSIYLSI